MWIVDIEFGRIGSTERRLRQVFPDQPAARAYMRRGLRRRATAPARIGVAYWCMRSSVEASELLSKLSLPSARG
jgi:hypothetical protein